MIAEEQRRATLTGIGYMVVSMAIVAVQDATTKWLAGGYPVGEVIFFRSVFTMLPIAFFVWRAGGRPALRTRRPGAHGLRAGLMVCCMFLFVLALSLMPLADAVTLTFTGPMFVTELAPVLLGERVGWQRWLAVAVGFAGVVVVLRPGTGTLQLVVIVPVLAALASALRDVVTRRMGPGESPAAIMFYTTLALLGASALTLPMGWAWVTIPDLGLFLVAGVLVAAVEFLQIKAIRLAELSVILPFRYTAVLWAVLAGFLVWGHLPDAYVIAGGALVIVSGLYILHRETGRRAE